MSVHCWRKLLRYSSSTHTWGWRGNLFQASWWNCTKLLSIVNLRTWMSIWETCIVSVGDRKIQTKLLAMLDDMTFSKAMQMALGMESAALNAEDIHSAAPPSISCSSSVSLVSDGHSALRGPCFSCGGDHYCCSSNFKDTACHTCSRKGHISKLCWCNTI